MSPELIFVDTNLFLRYLTNDVPTQADAVEKLLHKAAQAEIKLITTSLVIAEIVWTLESYYRLSSQEVQEKILAILNTPGLQIVDAEVVLQAILWYVEKSVDYIDAFHAAWMLKQDIDRVYTFDRKHFERFEELLVSLPGE